MSTTSTTYALTSKTRLEVLKGDLTRAPVDAIVNAANKHLAHGGGVAAAIAQAGGRSIQKQSDEWVHQHGPVTHSEPAYTRGGKLPARYIIHAVGPIWGQGDEDAKLASAIRGSLVRAEELGLQSIAFPAISTGIYGFPVQRAARIFFDTFKTYFTEKQDTSISLVQMILWSDELLRIFVEESEQVISNKGENQ